jgi:hypothetical protein
MPASGGGCIMTIAEPIAVAAKPNAALPRKRLNEIGARHLLSDAVANDRGAGREAAGQTFGRCSRAPVEVRVDAGDRQQRKCEHARFGKIT